ncbi:carbon-nitrogen hydrolase family protein [Sandaracinobacteroides saxicola]|uniref:Carbon-nitrogen hydrolase family protein n=1 Tax=Sandaracinobacteroides saxicola TaxID=2759707 RepID=A0A7G5IME0_9SPHN|nr:carbon-nitrogen hydrolase family protein [Sandaracinobacteroides saxicola]QMW24532.1 carbon-nitrogen hydrolase family protein [Sandaracinobacteroides saxicola]
MRVGLLQTTSGIDPAANADMLAAGVAELADRGAAIIFTPEMSGLLDRNGERLRAHVRGEADDSSLAALRSLAAERGVWVALGSLAIALLDGRIANRSFLIDATGAIVARYDKLHLFDVDLPTGERHRESATYAAGEGPVLAATPWGPLGLSICYDVRFPHLYHALARAGAAMLAVPAAFTVPTGAAHWHVLLRARAIETGSFVIAAAQTGKHADGRETFGHSLVIDPWGRVLHDSGTEAGAAVVDIDLAQVADIRARIPALAHARSLPTVARW